MDPRDGPLRGEYHQFREPLAAGTLGWVLGMLLHGLRNPLTLEHLAIIRLVLGILVLGYLASKGPWYR